MDQGPGPVANDQDISDPSSRPPANRRQLIPGRFHHDAQGAWAGKV